MILFMKKHVFFALVAFVLVGLTSCDKSEPCRYHSRTLDLTVLDKDWKWDKDKEIFFYGFDVPVPAIGEEFDLALVGKKGTWYDHKVIVTDPIPEA